ncbi:MAG: HIT domain-containing protein [Candidatus Gracilibacteria bacterium]
METNDFYCDFVLNEKIVVKKIYESEDVLAFHHTKPSYEFHVVVIPRKHILNIVSIESDSVDGKGLWIELLKGVQGVVKECKLETFRIISNSGDYQDSKHLHIHVVSGQKIL